MKIIKNSIGMIANMSVGSAAIQSVGDSSMPSGLKSATQSMVGVGLAADAYKKFGKIGRGKKWY